jgi:cytochrome c oxidase subunit 3
MKPAKLGMWAFILTEVLTFAGLFVAYIVFRSWYPDMFVGAHKLLLDVNKGLMNTIVLITSSLTMVHCYMGDTEKKPKTIFIHAYCNIFICFYVLRY